MSRFRVLLFSLLVAGCAQSPERASTPQTSGATRRVDTLCMQDCMGSQAGKQFCEDRCSF